MYGAANLGASRITPETEGNVQTITEEYVSTVELARRWGVSRHTIARWRKRKGNPLPAENHPGSGRTRFRMSQVEEWMKNGEASN